MIWLFKAMFYGSIAIAILAAVAIFLRIAIKFI